MLASVKMAVFWVVAPCRAIALMMEAASTSETSVNFYQTTRRNNSEYSHLHTRRRENLKSHARWCFEKDRTILYLVLTGSTHIIILSPYSTLSNLCSLHSLKENHT
jgi:hypothetical protein